MPLVSVVMLSYNHEKFVAESIESVLGQDFNDFELIIVDDASTDSSRQIIQKYAAEDSRIRVILHEANCGIAKTVNDGIEAVKGRFTAITASDDVWAKDKLTKQLAVTASNENLIVWSEGELIDENGRPLDTSFSEFHGSVSRKKSGDISQELLKGNYIFPSTLLFKKTNLGEIRFDESIVYLNDYKFVLDLARKYEFYYMAEPLAAYRIHTTNTLAALAGSSPGLHKRQVVACREYISIYEDVLREYEIELSAETKAAVYSRIGYNYKDLSEKKMAVRFFLQAIRANPYCWSNIAYSACILKVALSDLLPSRT